jgi:DNA modification methylase
VNSIIQGDAFRELPKLPSRSVDLVCVDPPYDLDQERKEFLHREFRRLSRGGVIVFSPPENQWLPAEQYGFWIKPISTKNTSRRYSRFVEMIFFYDCKWRPGRHWSQYTNVFTDLVEGATDHPYEKPLSLLLRLIRNHSDAGDVVIDPFLGSGTTALAAKMLGRGFIGIEQVSRYRDIARGRLAAVSASSIVAAATR